MSVPLRAALAGASLALASTLGGCALNSSLEVEMKLPYEDGGLPRARVQVCGEECDFGSEWIRPARVVEIGPDAPDCETGGDCNVRFSVVTEQTGAEVLRVKVRFCDTDCETDITSSAPEIWFELQEPFVQGHRTYWRPSAGPFLRVPAVQPTAPPTAPIVVPKCEISDDCWPPDSVPLTEFGFCDSDGLRFCESGRTVM